jgi:NAD(P)-dependent dehydrogenase (short-subunit alcohol dehydrogenase family)
VARLPTNYLLSGQVGLVTGGGQGIGQGVSLAFASEGAAVGVLDIVADRAEETAELIRARGGRALALPCDVRIRAEVDSAVSRVAAELGNVDVLVNAAIAGSPRVPIMKTSDELMETMWKSGVMGSLFCMQACYPHFAGRGGRIINFGSRVGMDGIARYAAYGTAKEAIRSLTKVAAHEWAADGIRVYTICPYGNSPGVQEMAARRPERMAASLFDVPLGRVGDVEEDIGRAAVMLASNLASYVTGQTLMVDGGRRML